MIFRLHKNNFHKNDFWIGFSDLMTGLMLVFIVLSLTFMAIAKIKIDESDKAKIKMENLIKKIEKAKKELEKKQKNIIVVLSKQLSLNNIKVEYDEKKGTITIAQDILFERKKPDLNHEGKAFIKLFATVLDKNIFQNDSYRNLIKYIHIEGYASKEGSIEHNFKLSFQRAENVWLYMTNSEINNKRIMEQKLNIVSRGEIDAEQDFVNPSDRKVIFRFEFYDTYNKIFEGLSR